MKVQVIVGVAVLAVVTVAASAAASGGSPARLPLPQPASGSHQTQAAKSTGSTTEGTVPGTADANSASNGGTDQPTTYIASPPAALTGCTVSISNPAPLRGQTTETATVTTTAGAEVRLQANYVKTRSVHDGLADSSGSASFVLAISHAPPGVTVGVTATVSLRGAKDSCSTSFTPVDPVSIFPTAGGGQ